MKITRVESFHLHTPLQKHSGCSICYYDARDVLLVKLTTDDGLVGWGETAPLPGLQGLIDDGLAPLLLGKNPLDHRKLWREMWGANFGNGLAVAAVDIALHDLWGKALNVPINALHGGKFHDRIPVYVSGMNYTEGMEPEEEYPANARDLVKRGFKAMKLRIGRYPPRREFPIFEAVRAAVGPDVKLMADGNAAYTFPTAVEVGKELYRLGFTWFEEPTPQYSARYPGYEALREKLDIALAGGEAVDSRGAAKDLIERRCFDIIQPDVSLCGGVAECLFIAEMAREWGMLFYPHCWGGAIVVAASTHVISSLPDFHWGHTVEGPILELDDIENPFRTDLAVKPVVVRDGFAEVPTGPGLGIDINEDVVKKYLKKKK